MRSILNITFPYNETSLSWNQPYITSLKWHMLCTAAAHVTTYSFQTHPIISSVPHVEFEIPGLSSSNLFDIGAIYLSATCFANWYKNKMFQNNSGQILIFKQFIWIVSLYNEHTWAQKKTPFSMHIFSIIGRRKWNISRAIQNYLKCTVCLSQLSINFLRVS